MRRNLTPDDAIAAMRMSGRDFRGTWLLCEGETDRAVLERFVATGQCRVQPCQGKRGVLIVMQQRARARLGRAIGVVDTDFWWDAGRGAPDDVITTDCHDLEAMLVASPALDAVLREHVDEDRLAAFLRGAGQPTLRDLLYDRCRPSATLRMVSMRHDLGLRFARLWLDEYLEPTKLRFDAARYVRDVHARSDTPATLDEVGRMFVAALREQHDPAMLCQGHDLVRVLTYALREGGFAVRPTSAYRSDLVEKDLRLAYDSRYFRRTRLYRSAAAWNGGRGEALFDV